MTTPSPKTINTLFAGSAKRHPSQPALTAKSGKEWKSLTFARIESRLRAFSLGLRALVAPNFERLAHWAIQNNVPFTDHKSLAATPEARKAVKQEIDQYSPSLADFEKIRRIALLDHPLSIDAGELTPTLKVKRRVIQERYGHLLD